MKHYKWNVVCWILENLLPLTHWCLDSNLHGSKTKQKTKNTGEMIVDYYRFRDTCDTNRNLDRMNDLRFCSQDTLVAHTQVYMEI